LDELTSSQLSEWEAYDRLEPIGTHWQEYRESYLCSFLTNVVRQRYPEEGRPPVLTLPTDFMHVYDREELNAYIEQNKHKQSVEEMKQALLSIVGTKPKNRVRKPKTK
jgi:hypothetical protein